MRTKSLNFKAILADKVRQTEAKKKALEDERPQALFEEAMRYLEANRGLLLMDKESRTLVEEMTRDVLVESDLLNTLPKNSLRKMIKKLAKRAAARIKKRNGL